MASDVMPITSGCRVGAEQKNPSKSLTRRRLGEDWKTRQICLCLSVLLKTWSMPTLFSSDDVHLPPRTRIRISSLDESPCKLCACNGFRVAFRISSSILPMLADSLDDSETTDQRTSKLTCLSDSASFSSCFCVKSPSKCILPKK